MTTNKKYVAYYRVSTKKQGQSGLGLESQRSLVHSFTQNKDEIIAHFTETESGKNNSRPELTKAIGHAKKHNAKLLIAKLDRLSRNAGFIFSLRDSGVDFVCCDIPEANTLTIGIFAVLAQHERELISKRTKDALSAKKARGYKLGKPENLTKEAREKGRRVHSDNAKNNKANIQAREIALSKKNEGFSLQQIANYLNSLDYRTSRGCFFCKTTIYRLLKPVVKSHVPVT